MAIVMLKPVFPPYVCLVCGVGTTQRKWYVDLELPLDNYFNPVNDGAAYLCNECWDSLVRSVGSKAHTIMKEIAPWDESPEPTYTSDEEIVLEYTIGGQPEQPVGEINVEELTFGSGISSEGTGESDSTTTGDDTNPETTNDEPNPDANPDDSQPVREFREFFGNPV